MNLEKILLPIIKDAAKIMLREHSVDGNEVASKLGDANFVTVYDKAVQDFLLTEITKKIPNATFVAEEQENDYSILSGEYVFVIDPIDGTTNFIHGYKHSSISVACISKNEIVFGAVYNPYLDEMFYATRGGGAYVNGEKMTVSEREPIDSVCVFGSSPYYKEELGEKSFEILKNVFYGIADIRRMASAAIDLCYVAAGRAESFFELRISPWDFAAAALIITEAGGIITDLSGNPITLHAPCSVIASNKNCYSYMLDAAKRAGC